MAPRCDGNGRGEGHCCVIGGRVCEFVTFTDSGTARCSMWDRMDSDEWRASMVGQAFAERWPGKTCRDWPQDIPEVMSVGVGLCCWRSE